MVILFRGTDLLYVTKWPVKDYPSDLRKIPYILSRKLLFWFLSLFTKEYYVDHKYLEEELRTITKKKITVLQDTIQYGKYPKKEHESFNVLYYYPVKRYNKKLVYWLYGKDIIDQVKCAFTDINWIEVRGDEDMSKLFPIVDLYIRPTRHDGLSRLRKECLINEIPVYWNPLNPNYRDCFNFIKQEYGRKFL